MSPPESESTRTRLARSNRLLWQGRERPTRGPRPGLTLDRIVETAIAVADAEGLEALSMRRVARELGVGTMSLYRYVPGKAELLDLMLEKVSDPAEEVAQARGRDWRGVLEVGARAAYRSYLEHPWLLQVVNLSRPVFGPNILAGVDYRVAGLAGTGLSDREKVMAISVIDGYCIGAARSHVQYLNAARETGITDEEYWQAQLPVLEQAMASGRFPALAALAEDAWTAGWEETFEFGLQRLLDGLEAVIATRSRRRPAGRSRRRAT